MIQPNTSQHLSRLPLNEFCAKISNEKSFLDYLKRNIELQRNLKRSRKSILAAIKLRRNTEHTLYQLNKEYSRRVDLVCLHSLAKRFNTPLPNHSSSIKIHVTEALCYFTTT